MLTSRLDIPADSRLGDLAGVFDPAAVLDACRSGLRRIDKDERDAWCECRFIEAFYHPGRYLRAAFALLMDPNTPSNRFWPEATIVYLHTPVRAPMSDRGECLTIHGVNVEAYAFPNDRRLRSARKFQGREQALEAWQQWLEASGDAFQIDGDSLRRVMIRYVPEKRWVLRLRCRGTEANGSTGKRSIAVRCTTPTQCRLVADQHEEISRIASAAGTVRVPAIVGRNDDRGILAVEWIRGADLVSQLTSESASDLIAEAARTTHAFHRLPVSSKTTVGLDAIRSMMEDALTDLLAAVPELADEFVEVCVKTLEVAAQSAPMAANVFLHNDLHPRQFRVKSRQLALLDLDRACRGGAVIDVANFAAQIEALGNRQDSELNESRASQLAHEFVSSYESVSGVSLNDDHLQVFCVAAHLSLARGMMRHLRPGWRELVTACVRRALVTINSGHNSPFANMSAGDAP